MRWDKHRLSGLNVRKNHNSQVGQWLSQNDFRRFATMSSEPKNVRLPKAVWK